MNDLSIIELYFARDEEAIKQTDLTAVKDYIITPIVPNTPGEEMAGEVYE